MLVVAGIIEFCNLVRDEARMNVHSYGLSTDADKIAHNQYIIQAIILTNYYLHIYNSDGVCILLYLLH